MGNLNSSTYESNNLSKFATTMLNTRPNYTDHQSINFTRNDLLNSVSELSIGTALRQYGGGKDELENIPTRNRYREYETTKTMKSHVGGSTVNPYSSASEVDLSMIKNMIIGSQNGGGCGCDGNTVFQDGGNYGNVASSDSFVLNMTSSQSSVQLGGDCSITSATSPMRQEQVGGNLSATSSFQSNGLSASSATSSARFSQMGGNFSATSPMEGNASMNSATLSARLSQMGGNFSATSPNNSYLVGKDIDDMQQANDNTETSNFSLPARSVSEQIGGNNNIFSATSETGYQQGGLNSPTSSIPIKYSSILGGAKDENKKEKKEKDSSSSSSEPKNLDKDIDDDDSASSESSTSVSLEDDSLARALARQENKTSDRSLARSSSKKTKSKSKHDSSSTASSSNTSSTSTVSSITGSSSSHTTSTGSSTQSDAIYSGTIPRQTNYVYSTSGASDSVVNVKQFYSSEHGDIYSSDSNFLRNNISRNRLR